MVLPLTEMSLRNVKQYAKVRKIGPKVKPQTITNNTKVGILLKQKKVG